MAEAAALANITRMPELTQLKDWLADGALHFAGWSVEHVVQPSDAIALPPLADHTLGFWLQVQGDRHIRFDGQIDGQTQAASPAPNQFFLLPAGTPAEFRWAGKDEAVLVSIRPEALHQTVARMECLAPHKLELKPLPIAQDEHITHLIYCLLHEIRTEGLGSHLCSESLMMSLNVHLLRQYCAEPVQLHCYQKGLSRDRLSRALEVIHTSLDQALSLEMIANELGLDMHYFSRLFRDSMGITPYQYVLRQRVEKAKKLLRNRELSITEIAQECGFTNASQLAYHFRKFVGISPKTYQQQVRQMSGMPSGITRIQAT